MRRVITAVLLLAALAIALPAPAQDAGPTLRFFRDQAFYEPLLAEPRPARNMLLIPAWSKEFPDSVEKGSRFAWQINLGDEFPILTLRRSVRGADRKGQWGFGLWTPVSFHMIEDFKDSRIPSSTPTIASGS